MFHIEADNPKGLNYDEVHETAEGAAIAVRTIIRRGGKRVRVNGKEIAAHHYEGAYI